MHGHGDTPENVAHLVTGIGVRARIIAPHGRTPIGSGWSWFSLRWQKSLEELAPEIARAADEVLGLIDGDVRARPTCGRPIVTGLSQGGVLSYAIAARAPTRIAAALPVSGFLVPSLRPARSVGGVVPRIDAFHGEVDPTVELRAARATHAAFREAGYPGTLRTYPNVGHTTTPTMERELHAAIERAVREQGCAR